jgi:hypothetical protein
MPFVTEELWQRLPRGPDAGTGPRSIMVADYPAPGDALAADWRDQQVLPPSACSSCCELKNRCTPRLVYWDAAM